MHADTWERYANLIMLDSNDPGRSIGGRVGREQLNWLSTVLSRHAERGCHIRESQRSIIIAMSRCQPLGLSSARPNCPGVILSSRTHGRGGLSAGRTR